MGTQEPKEVLIRRLEETLLDPTVRRKPEVLADLLADDFLEFGSSGIVYDKNRTLQAFGSEAPIRMDITDFRVVELSGNVVLATYRVSRFDTSFESIAHSLRSSVWRRSGDRWKIVFHQGAPTTASK